MIQLLQTYLITERDAYCLLIVLAFQIWVLPRKIKQNTAATLISCGYIGTGFSCMFFICFICLLVLRSFMCAACRLQLGSSHHFLWTCLGLFLLQLPKTSSVVTSRLFPISLGKTPCALEDPGPAWKLLNSYTQACDCLIFWNWLSYVIF